MMLQGFLNSALTVVVAGSFMALPVAFASEEPTEGYTLFALSVPSSLSQKIDDKALVSTYMSQQLTAYNLTQSEYLALSPEDQREVMCIPGRQTPFSRQERRAFVPLKKSVPISVISSITEGTILPAEVIEKYGVTLPANLSDVQEGVMPLGYLRLLIGDQYVIINKSNKVVKSITL